MFAMTKMSERKLIMKLLYLLILSLTVFIMSCGEGDVTIDPSKYEAKIVIDGYLYPNQQVDRIKISRNLPIGTNISKSDLVSTPSLSNSSRSINRGLPAKVEKD